MQNNRQKNTALLAAEIERSNAEALAWLGEFKQQSGRALRVLHIGNIANNAYNNAKIQRSLGIEADVLCYDYYHIMGTPEWEDTDIKGSLDNFHPDWWAVDLGNWQRPDWFVQGPLLDCLDYLRAKHRGTNADRLLARRRLVQAYWDILDEKATTNGKRRRWLSPMTLSALRTTLKIAPELTLPGTTLRERATACWNNFALPVLSQLSNRASLNAAAKNVRIASVDPALVRRVRGETAKPMDHVRIALFRTWRAQVGLSAVMEPTHYEGSGSEPQIARLESLRRYGRLSFHSVAWGGSKVLSKISARIAPRTTSTIASPLATTSATLARREAVREHYRRSFADVPSAMLESELTHADCLSGHLSDVMAHYDIVQAYSTDGLTPLFAGVTRFCAYEHGTIREIPFEDNLQGRLCKFTYRHAPRVFVTNSDVLPSIPRIGIPAHRVTNLPHAFNDGKLRKFRDDNPQLLPPTGIPILFSPTRHHWHVGGGSWTKGNDVLLRAAGRLHKEGRDFRLRCVEWGQEVDKSKALIDELGIAHLVEWVPTMTKRQLWAAYCQSHVVVDQFALPALGGVAFEALALGRRLITRIDESTLEQFFGAAPPLLNGETVDDVTRQIAHILDDPNDEAKLGQKARQWIEIFHSSTRTLALQARAYRDLMLDQDEPDIPKSGSA